MKVNQYNLVNWETGLEVGFMHLQQMENYFIERLADNQASRLNRNNYGLLPSPGGQGDSSAFDISEQVTGKVEIKLRRCNALTAGGYRISYNPGEDGSLLYTHSFGTEKETATSEMQYWDVILTINPFRRIPSGIPDAETLPPHHPDAVEYYGLSIALQGKSTQEQLGAYHLVIGRIRRNGGRYEVDTNYIPPSTSMRSHPDLLKYGENFGKYLNGIEKASGDIIAKIRNRSQNSPLAYHLAVLCEEISRYIASIYFIYRNEGRDLPPIRIVNFIASLAHACHIGLNFIGKTEKEELLKYFYEWSDVTPGSFEDLLSNTLSLIYEHNAIRTVMLQIESFLHVFSELWIKLSQLEYIGQHKENIVVSERVYQEEAAKSRGGWTILD
jgi:hypothetical protein